MRFFKLTRALFLAAVLTGAATMSGGCADNRTSLVILMVQGLDENCEVEPAIDSDGRARGLYDPSFEGGYVAYLLLGNGLQPLGDNDTLRAETSRIQIEGCEVSIAAAGGGAFPSFTMPIAFTIHPDDSEDLGLASVPVEIIPYSIGADMGYGTYLITLKVFGTTLGGKRVESGEFTFPVDVTNLARCTTFDEAGPSAEALGCYFYGQDGPVYCGGNGIIHYPNLGGCARCVPVPAPAP